MEMQLNNGERPPYVKFEREAREDKKATLDAGYSVSRDVDYAYVHPQGSRDVIVKKVDAFFDNATRKVRNGRIPQAYLDFWKQKYSAFKEGQEAPVDGTPIKEWSAISPAQIKNLIAINILTVEDLAGINDDGLRRIGMGALELKRKAKNWLDSAEDNGKVALKITQLETEKERDRLTIESLTEKVNMMAAQLQNMQTNTAMIQDVPRETISASDILEEPVVQERVVNYQGMGHYELIEAYKHEFGKAPHHKMKDETIRRKLEE